MVDLTENLPNATSSRRIIDPGKDGPSIFEGVANVLSEGISRTARLFEESEADARQRAASARQAEEDERQARERLGKDRLAGIMWEARDRFDQPGALPPLADNLADFALATNSSEGAPTNPALARVLAPAINELQRARAAEEQGRSPSGSYRVMLERNISQLMAEMPDQQFEIFTALREAGFNHYLFREAESDQKYHEANINQDIAMRNEAANAAVSRGLVEVGTDPMTAARIGQVALYEEYQAKLLKEQGEAARAGSAEARAQYEHNKRLADDEARRNFAANLSSVIQPRWNQLANILTQANGSTEAISLLPDALRGMDVIVENYIAAARQNGVSEEVINSMRSDYDNMKESAIGFVSGPESDHGVGKIALEGIQTRMGLQLAEALPTYMALQEVFGATALSTMFGPEGNISQEMVDAARRELRGIQGAIDTDQERVTMATAARILRGELQITELNEAEARAQMPVLVTTINGQAAEVARGGGNPNSLINGNLAVYNAAMELQPGNNSVASEIIAVNTLFHGQQRQALERIRQEDPAQGEMMTRAARSTAMHLWTNLRSHRLNETESADGLWGLRYNTDTGRFVPQISQSGYNAWLARNRPIVEPGSRGAAGGSALVNRVPTMAELSMRPPTALTRLVETQNRVVDFLTATSQYDPQFQGVDTVSAREFYTQGTIPQAMRRRMEAEQATAATVNEQAQAFRQGLDADRVASENIRDNAITTRIANEDIPPPAGAVQDTVKSMAERVGVSWETVNRLVQKESGWDITADSGSSQGLFQVNAPNAGSMTWQENAQEGLKRWVDANQNATRALGRQATDADAYVAYQQGPGGGVALLKPENARRPAIDVLAPLYRDLATARSAIIGNGGNLNMTAAEFAQHIRDYFNR